MQFDHIVAKLHKYLKPPVKNVHSFKVNAVSYSKALHQSLIQVKIITCNSNVTLPAICIFQDINLLTGFSPLDVKTIVIAALDSDKTPTYRIVAYNFCPDNKEPSLQIADTQARYVVTKTVSEIVQDRVLLTSFKPLDIYRIGYFHGASEK
ncbi:MAG: hypothetical protein Tsb005_19300 [Gammaproteobacteria bacterium]